MLPVAILINAHVESFLELWKLKKKTQQKKKAVMTQRLKSIRIMHTAQCGSRKNIKMIKQHAAGENHGDYRFNLLVEV